MAVTKADGRPIGGSGAGKTWAMAGQPRDEEWRYDEPQRAKLGTNCSAVRQKGDYPLRFILSYDPIETKG